MQQHRHVLALLLLAVFAAGGVLGPALHYVEHAATDAAVHLGPQQHERPHEPASDAAGSNAWLTEVGHAVAGDLLCWLCHLVKTGKDPAAVSASAHVLVPVLVTGIPALSRVAGEWVSHFFVRGPPRRS